MCHDTCQDMQMFFLYENLLFVFFNNLHNNWNCVVSSLVFTSLHGADISQPPNVSPFFLLIMLSFIYCKPANM